MGSSGDVLLVAAGGFCGAIARYVVASWALRRMGGRFPYGTMAVNVIGAFAIGFVLAAIGAHQWTLPVRDVVVVGFLGAFTTFSTFSFETLTLVENGSYRRAAVNVTANLIPGLGAVWVGYLVGARV